MSEHDRERDKEKYAEFFELAVKQAQAGDREMAVSLIGEFAQLADDPHVFDSVGGIPPALIQHIASCLGDWQKRDFKDAETWFHVVRAPNAPDKTDGKHVAAMRAYLLLRARAKGTEQARAGAATYSGLTENQVQYLVEKDKPEECSWFKGRAIGAVTAAALMLIRPSLHDRVLNPPRKKYQRSR